MAKSRLTNIEKHAIENMHQQNIPVEDIAKELGRSVTSVQNHIDKIKPSQARQEDQEQAVKKVFVTDAVRQKAYKMLINAGLGQRDANDMLDAAEKKLIGKIKDPQDLYNIALRSRTVKNMMVRESQGGRSGVTIMTRAASESGDQTRGNRQKFVGRSRNAIWDTKTQKMVGEDGEEQD